MRADQMRAINLKQEVPDGRAEQNPNRKTCDADARGKEDAAEDDGEVVDERRERGHNEVPFRILNGGENASFIKAKLRRQHQASEEDDTQLFGRSKSGRDRGNELRRKNFCEADQSDDEEPHEGQNGGENAPAFFLAIFRGELGEHWNKRDAERASRDEVI